MQDSGMKTGTGRTGRRIVLLAALILLLSTIPFPTATASDGKMVRVLLESLKLSDRMTIEVYGSYLLDNRLGFQRGSRLEVSIRSGRLWVHYEGLAYRAEERFLLTRYQLADRQMENGLRLQSGLSLYTGSLSVSIQDGRLRAIMEIPIEEYLQGVVPYEMADEFPLEALKAQAIAARTYALANLKPKSDFDVVDSANDQVYRGLDPSKTNAVRAVVETAGTVCTYHGALAQCYYTASNGGLTESAYNAWGRERIDYLQIQEDKYDLENPSSEVRSASIPKNILPGGTNLNPQLYARLMADLSLRLGEWGYRADAGTLTLDSILGITPHTSRFGGDQGIFKWMRFDLSVSASAPVKKDNDSEISYQQAPQSPAPDEAPKLTWGPLLPLKQAVSIDLPVFPDLESMLSLSINANQNELVRIQEESEAFRILFSRYGHGVGLSQRGAEWMAKTYGWDARQILRFYYPGTALEQRDTAYHLPSPIPEDYLSTPGPIPTPSPRPTLMPLSTLGKAARIVKVSGISASSTLNLRLQPDLSSDVLMRLQYGQKLQVIRELQDGWLEVKTDVIKGFVRSEFVSEMESQSE